jgi:dUTP pyrophosphatase
MHDKIVRIKAEPGAILPEYGSAGSAGADLRAFIPLPIELRPGERAAIPTGLRMEIPEGYEAQIRPRSGLALEKGLTCLNSPGTIDSDYRGEVKVLLVNLGKEPSVISPGDRVAQLVVAPVWRALFEATSVLGPTGRGEGGFGSTGG